MYIHTYTPAYIHTHTHVYTYVKFTFTGKVHSIIRYIEEIMNWKVDLRKLLKTQAKDKMRGYIQGRMINMEETVSCKVYQFSLWKSNYTKAKALSQDRRAKTAASVSSYADPDAHTTAQGFRMRRAYEEESYFLTVWFCNHWRYFFTFKMFACKFMIKF